MCEAEKPYYLYEEEIRCDVFKRIRKDLVGNVRVWDCRFEQCSEYFEEGGYEFVPRTGDILLEVQKNLHLIELKYAKMWIGYHNITRKYFRTIHGMSITALQLEYLEKGLLTLVCIGELIEEPEKFGVYRGEKTKNAIEEDILTLRKSFGKDIIHYSYFIIDTTNYKKYHNYLKKLSCVDVKRGGKVVDRVKTISFQKMYNSDFPIRRYRAYRSNLAEDIVTQLIKRKVLS